MLVVHDFCVLAHSIVNISDWTAGNFVYFAQCTCSYMVIDFCTFLATYISVYLLNPCVITFAD